MRKFVSRVISSFLPTVLICTAALAASSSDSWVTGGPADQHWSDTSVVITPDRIIDLPLTARAKALSMLETKSIVSLDPISYLDLLPSKGYPADADRLPYLVRGVALNEKTGGFNVEQKGAEVLVVFAAARDDSPPKHRALVVLLPTPALRVFVQTLTVE